MPVVSWYLHWDHNCVAPEDDLCSPDCGREEIQLGQRRGRQGSIPELKNELVVALVERKMYH
jgi:hypothetical protein